MPDPLNFILGLVEQHIKDGLYVRVGKLLFSFALTAWGAFFFTCGACLISPQIPAWCPRVPFAIGTGFLAMVVCVGILYRQNKDQLLKGTVVVWPEAEAEQELITNSQLIQKTDSKTDQKNDRQNEEKKS